MKRKYWVLKEDGAASCRYLGADMSRLPILSHFTCKGFMPYHKTCKVQNLKAFAQRASLTLARVFYKNYQLHRKKIDTLFLTGKGSI